MTKKTIGLPPMQEQARPELDDMLRRAQAAFNALTPEEQRACREAQRRSWGIGEMMLEHPEMTREEAERIVDGALRNV